MPIKSNLQSLIPRLKQHSPCRVAVVCPDDDHTRFAIHQAESEGIAHFIVFTDDDKAVAARKAVAAVHRGEADVLMKGRINTDVLLRQVLDKEQGLLKKGAVLCHVAVAYVPELQRTIAFSDAAVIPQPTMQQFEAIAKSLIHVTHSMGEEQPRIALIHCTEKVSEKFPHTLCYQQLIERCNAGLYGSAIISGPMDVKTAFDSESAAIKGITSPVVGQADALIFPNIEAGNTFYKTITLLSAVSPAGILCGTTAPVVVTSRADTAQSKYESLILACLMHKADSI